MGRHSWQLAAGSWQADVTLVQAAGLWLATDDSQLVGTEHTGTAHRHKNNETDQQAQLHILSWKVKRSSWQASGQYAATRGQH
jgi:hypothetical protein